MSKFDFDRVLLLTQTRLIFGHFPATAPSGGKNTEFLEWNSNRANTNNNNQFLKYVVKWLRYQKELKFRIGEAVKRTILVKQSSLQKFDFGAFTLMMLLDL